jgi:NitT/TauT family transport system substrate-binding protein
MMGRLRNPAAGVLIFLCLPMLLCIACGQKEHRPGSVTLKVVSTSFLLHAPIFIAQEEGYFTQQGLDIEFVKMTSSGQGIPALIQGEVDVIPGAIRFNLLNAMARGAEIRFVADMGYVDPEGCIADALMARPALVEAGELNGPGQLLNRRIATNPSVFTGYFLDKLLNRAGLSLDDIDIENIPHPARPEALERGAVDLVTSSEPWTTRLLQEKQAILWVPYQEVIPDFQHSIIVYGPNLLVKNPEAGNRFMVAYLKAVRQYNEGKTPRNIEILAKHTGLDEELLTDCCWPAIRADGRINCESVLDFQRWAIERGLLDDLVTKEQFWDPHFVEHACGILDISTH